MQSWVAPSPESSSQCVLFDVLRGCELVYAVVLHDQLCLPFPVKTQHTLLWVTRMEGWAMGVAGAAGAARGLPDVLAAQAHPMMTVEALQVLTAVKWSRCANTCSCAPSEFLALLMDCMAEVGACAGC